MKTVLQFTTKEKKKKLPTSLINFLGSPVRIYIKLAYHATIAKVCPLEFRKESVGIPRGQLKIQ